MAGGPLLLDTASSVLVVIDVQDVLLPKIVSNVQMLRAQERLIAVARNLGVPIVVSEQYPKGLGRTVESLRTAIGEFEPIEKVSFGVMGEPAFASHVAGLGRRQLVMIGIETHICVLQSALQAAAKGYLVTVVADCVSARWQRDHDLAIAKLRGHGIEIDTWEMVAYQWLRQAGTPEFKATLPLFKD